MPLSHYQTTRLANHKQPGRSVSDELRLRRSSYTVGFLHQSFFKKGPPTELMFLVLLSLQAALSLHSNKLSGLSAAAKQAHKHQKRDHHCDRAPFQNGAFRLFS